MVAWTPFRSFSRAAFQLLKGLLSNNARILVSVSFPHCVRSWPKYSASSALTALYESHNLTRAEADAGMGRKSGRC